MNCGRSSIFAAALSSAILSACVLPPDVTLDARPAEGEPLHVVSAPASYGRFSPGVVNEYVGKGAKYGGATGALTGAATSLACGPWAPFCIAPLMLIGAAGGLVVGAGAGVIAGPSSNESALLQERLAAYSNYDRVVGDVVDEVRVRAGDAWRLDDSPRAWSVRIRIDSLDLQYLDHRVVPRMKSTVSLQKAGAPAGEVEIEAWISATEVEAWRDPAFAASQVRKVESALAETIFLRLAPGSFFSRDNAEAAPKAEAKRAEPNK